MSSCAFRGKAKAQAYLSGLGIEGIRIATTEGEMGRDPKAQYRSWASPNEAARWLAALQEGKGLKPASRDLLLAWMRATKTFPTRLKGRLAAGTDVAHDGLGRHARRRERGHQRHRDHHAAGRAAPGRRGVPQ